MYLYHLVPENLRGNTLYPLNQLATVYPDLYAQHAKKYEGRETLLDVAIPTLGCRWNDVLFFTAVPPEALAAARREAGYDTNMKFYKLPASQFEPEKTTVYLSRKRGLGPEVFADDEFVPFHPESIATYVTVPQATRDYYVMCKREGRRPLIFAHIPHILYRGSMDVRDLEVVEV